MRIVFIEGQQDESTMFCQHFFPFPPLYFNLNSHRLYLFSVCIYEQSTGMFISRFKIYILSPLHPPITGYLSYRICEVILLVQTIAFSGGGGR